MKALSLTFALQWFLSSRTELLSGTSKTNLHRLDDCGDSSTQIGPYSLVHLAYQGELIQQGIPSQAALVEAHRSGQINATILVGSAVKAKLMPAAALANPTYLDAVETAFWLYYLLHPVESRQWRDVQFRQRRSKSTEAARRIEQQYFLERRHFW